MTHDDYDEQIAPYLLGALPEDEHAAFEAHLAGCPQCRAEVARLRVATDALPNSPRQLAPPPELKDRIMEIVNREAELLRAAGPEADAPPAPSRPRRRIVAVLRRGWWSMRPELAVAVTIAVLALGAGGALLGQATFDGDDRPPVVQATVGDAKLILREDGHSTLVAANLTRPRPGHVYQVWLKRKGADAPEPTNALFSSGADGSASVDVPGDIGTVEQVLVTQEPDGGSPAPTSDPVIIAEPA